MITIFISILNKNKVEIARLNRFESCTTTDKIEGEKLLNFLTYADELKTNYLYDKENYLIADGQIYTVKDINEVSEQGEENVLEVVAEHSSYNLNENKFELFERSGSASTLMSAALVGSGFSFGTTDLGSTTIDLKIPFTNSRYLINRIAREFKAKLAYDNDRIDLYQSFANATGIRMTIKKNINSLARKTDLKAEGGPKVTYEIDVKAEKLEAFEKVSVGDAIIVIDEARGLQEIERIVSETEKDLLTQKVTRVILGDPNPEFADVILEVLEQPIIEIVEEALGDNVITEVIHEQVINVETAHILNAWIKNLYVNYVETNFDALLPSSGTTERNYIKVINEIMEFRTATLSASEVAPLLINDPNGSGGMVNVYYTAIGNHVDAYRYFTITHPRLVHKELTDAEVEAFKVLVKKTVKETVKMSMNFESFTSGSGKNFFMPIITLGAGVDATGVNGIGKIYKDDRGLVLQYVTSSGKTRELVIGEDGISGGGDSHLKKADFYTNGFKAEYDVGGVDYEWTKDSQGRITQLKTKDGVIIPIGWNGGVMPT